MALVPVMPVDLFELSNNHVWQTEFAFRDFGEAPAAVHERRAGREGLHGAGLDRVRLPRTTTPCSTAASGCGRRPGRPRACIPVPLGFGRVYVRLDGGLDERAWLRGLDAGRSFVTTGPMLLVTLDGHDPGHRFEPADPEAREYRLRGSASGAMPLERIEVVINGEVARTIRPANRETGRAYESPIDEALTLDGTSWVAVRCFEDRPDGRVRFAHSGPFHVDVAARSVATASCGGRIPGPSGRGPDRPECRCPPPAGAR